MRVLLWVLVGCACVCAGCRPQPSAGPRVATQVAFSPDGEQLLLVGSDSATGATPVGACTAYVIAISLKADQLVAVGQIVSEGAAWSAAPEQAIWAIVLDDGACRFAALEPGGGREPLSRSVAFPAGRVGPVAVSRDGSLVGAIVGIGEPRPRLVVWDIAKRILRERPLPAGFAPSERFPPVFGGDSSLVAVVRASGDLFLCVQVQSGRWLLPRTVSGRTWHWLPTEKSGIPGDSRRVWKSGGGFYTDDDRDTFLVDEKALALWVISAEVPAGLTPTKDGFIAHPTDTLSALDLARARERPGALACVWRREACAVSATPDLSEVAMLYSSVGRDGQQSGDCVLYALGPKAPTERLVLLEDGSVLSRPGLSISPQGDKVALVRRQDGKQVLTVLSAPDGKVIASLPLPIGE